jgi:hypothetical protein
VDTQRQVIPTPSGVWHLWVALPRVHECRWGPGRARDLGGQQLSEQASSKVDGLLPQAPALGINPA